MRLNLNPFRTSLRHIVCTLVSVPAFVWAATTVTVKVTVVAPPSCVINDNKTIDVDFGTVVGPSVDGQKYMKTVDYTLECKGHTSNAMKMMIKGNPTTFDSSALQTNIADFGIALKANGETIGINDWVNFTYPDKPALQAVPVKKSGSTPAGGDFQAAATLMIAYQ
ncbi:fimbrial protein [Enterobacter sp. WCHEn045836]|uniref:fimbrial protein n=1 Tax=Enterobacter sp. WCHEn045836 TaxID=2497434 RepID=UPI000F827A43|nr:fimbrial protein [Enterobacter sp. WCHEn045836]RTP97278.1 fimbrial protein [Enterobacter sp. WCHEn045836]